MNRLSVRLTLLFVAVVVLTVVIVSLLADINVGTQFRRFLQEQAGTVVEQTQGAHRGGMMGAGQGQGMRYGQMMRPAEQNFINNLRETLLIAGVVASAAGIALGVIFSRTLSAPLREVSAAAQDFAARRWDRRARVGGTQEIRELALTFNSMADTIQQAETQRRNLMADVAHELRTPLTVMQGSLRALLDSVYPLEMKEVASLYDETRLLARLVEDLRQLALAEANQPQLNLQTVDLKTLLQHNIERFALAADAQGIALKLDAPETVLSVRADPDRLSQVINNLLVNALRHTPQGEIRVSYAPHSADSVKITVKDTGEGIPPEELPVIFERFHGGGKPRERGSTGLGLAIARAWVEAMGGSIGVESAPAQGTNVWFTLRRAELAD